MTEPNPQPEPSGSSSTANTPQDSVHFPLKIINWQLDTQIDPISTPILLQEKNGPCPLIALCNTLLLNHDIRIRSVGGNNDKDIVLDEIPTYFTNPQDRTKEIAVDNFKTKLTNKFHSQGEIRLDEVLEYIGDLLLVYIEGKEDRFKFNIDELLLNLPKLHTGLNVNPILYSGEFQQDLSTELFEIFDLKFKHGWIIDPINEEPNVWNNDEYRTLVELINSLEDFDRIQDYLLHEDSDPEIHENKELLSKWLSLNQTQLTKQGISELNESLDIDEFVVFFRNNHFNTLFKKSENEFYLLLTDSSFVGVNHPGNKPSKIIWQSLNSVSGNDDLFFTGGFSPVLDIDQDLPNVGDEQHHNTDYLLLKQLQEEEDQKMAERLQTNYDKRKTNGKTPNEASKSSSTTTTTNPGTAKLKEGAEVKKNKVDDKEKKKKKIHCIIT